MAEAARQKKDRWMSLKEINEELSVSSRTIRSALESGKLRFYRFERQIRIRYSDLLEFMDECAKKFNPRLLQRLYTNDGEAESEIQGNDPAATKREEPNGNQGN